MWVDKSAEEFTGKNGSVYIHISIPLWSQLDGPSVPVRVESKGKNLPHMAYSVIAKATPGEFFPFLQNFKRHTNQLWVQSKEPHMLTSRHYCARSFKKSKFRSFNFVIFRLFMVSCRETHYCGRDRRLKWLNCLKPSAAKTFLKYTQLHFMRHRSWE